MEAKLSSNRIMSAACLDTSEPAMPIAMPMSAFFSAGESFTPSPVTATMAPCGVGVVGSWGCWVVGSWGHGVVGSLGHGIVTLWGLWDMGLWGHGVVGWWGHGVMGCGVVGS